jgi:hypothetical protein
MAARMNRACRAYIRNQSLRGASRTAGEGRGRVYVVDQGTISSIPGTREETDVALVWCDAATGFRVMTCRNEEASLAAMTEKKLVIDGSVREFMWFSTALAKMMAR